MSRMVTCTWVRQVSLERALHLGEVDAVGRACGGVDRGGPRAAVAGAEHVRADYHVLGRVQGSAGAEYRPPPLVQAGVASEGVTDHQQVVPTLVEFPEGVVADPRLGQDDSGLQSEVADGVDEAGAVHAVVLVLHRRRGDALRGAPSRESQAEQTLDAKHGPPAGGSRPGGQTLRVKAGTRDGRSSQLAAAQFKPAERRTTYYY